MPNFKVEKLPPLDIPRPNDVMDDFYIIASHELHASNTAATENHTKGLKGRNQMHILEHADIRIMGSTLYSLLQRWGHYLNKM